LVLTVGRRVGLSETEGGFEGLCEGLKLIEGEVDGGGLLVGFADGLAVGSVEIVG